jgi:hypothetical protein
LAKDGALFFATFFGPAQAAFKKQWRAEQRIPRERAGGALGQCRCARER